MPHTPEALTVRRAAQLKALAEIRPTLPLIDRCAVIAMFEDCRGATGLDLRHLSNAQLELIEALAVRYLQGAEPVTRQAMQDAGTHPAPCARHCEENAFRVELRRRDAEIANLRAENAHLKNALALVGALRDTERNLPI